jgi:hypothetical protein
MLNERRVWGEIPQGFVKIVDAGGARLLVRHDQVAAIDFSMCRSTGGSHQASRFQGREPLGHVRLGNGESVLIRSYRHGGILRALTRGIFATWPPRPFRELTITEELRRRGVPTVEAYAACVHRLRGPFYRGWLVTRELEEAQDLWAAFQSGLADSVGVERVLASVASSLRAIHRQGVYHTDLNLKNILVRDERDGIKGYIIDFDKARLLLGPVPAELVKRNLSRLLRSIRKLDPERVYFPPQVWAQFVNLYYATD